MKRLSLSVIVLAAACSILFLRQPGASAAPGDGASLLNEQEAREAHAVIASMLAAGFPDTAKAGVYAGKLTVSATFDPTKGPSPLPTSASTMQMTIPNSSKVNYGFTFQGLHFKLADGSWVIAMQYRFKPSPGDNVGVTEATKIDLATLSADAAAAHPFDAAKSAAKYLERVAPAERERCKASMNRLAPVLRMLRLDPEATVPAVVLLDRAGWSRAADLSVVISHTRARSYWMLRPWTTPDPIFDPTGEYPTMQKEEQGWKAAQATFTPESPQVALRRALFRWCRAQMMVEEPEDAMLPLTAAAAATKACIDPKDPQNNAARVDGLAAGARLPVSVAPDAVLATRLQSWEGRARMPRMSVTGGGGALSPQISTSFTAPAPAYTPQKTDYDALVELLADERPSRFNDFSGPRTVGDNAWRALAMLLKSDPRTLAGYPIDHPWTAAERMAAATAVQAWWKEHRKEYVEK